MNILDRNHVTVRGNEGGPAIVFAHGFGCNQTMWRLVAPKFERDHRVVCFDHVGAGSSHLASYSAARYGTLHAYAEDVLEICEALDLEHAVLVGHSVSAMIGVLAANRAPHRIARLVLVCPSPRYIDQPPDYRGGFAEADIRGLLDLMDRNDLGWATLLASMVLAPAHGASENRELLASFCATDPVIARQFAEVTFFSDHRDDAMKSSVPSLILQCTDDPIAPREVGRWLERNMPSSSYRELDARGHCPHLNAPAETCAAIRAWM